MAEPPVDHHPSPPHPSPPPTKRTKRSHNASNNSDDETKDTASSVPENDEEQPLPDDLKVYQELEKYEIRHGGNPAQDRYHMERFYFSYTFLGVGNEAAWEDKFQSLRDKFKNRSEESVEPEQMKEFLLWKKMFDRVVVPDA